MTWYAAHTIMAFVLKGQEQEEFSVWENIYLIEAETPNKACEKAEEYARVFEGDSDGTLTVNDKPATLQYQGIRKLITISNINDESDVPGDGAEISYSSFVVKNREELNNLVSGEPVNILYED